jgi:hypothetical protein
LLAFGAPPDIVEALRHSGPEEIVWLGRAPTRIDLLRSIPGVEFNSAWSRRITVELEGVRVPVIGKEDLIRNKLAVGRAQDLRDARHLQSTAEGAKGSKGRRHKATRRRSTRKVK